MHYYKETLWKEMATTSQAEGYGKRERASKTSCRLWLAYYSINRVRHRNLLIALYKLALYKLVELNSH